MWITQEVHYDNVWNVVTNVKCEVKIADGLCGTKNLEIIPENCRSHTRYFDE